MPIYAYICLYMPIYIVIQNHNSCVSLLCRFKKEANKHMIYLPMLLEMSNSDKIFRV